MSVTGQEIKQKKCKGNHIFLNALFQLMSHQGLESFHYLQSDIHLGSSSKHGDNIASLAADRKF